MHPTFTARRLLDPRYPAALRALGDRAPDFLEAEGRLASEIGRSHMSVAIVGTREAPDWALVMAHYLGRRIADAGGCVISGGARGIDAAAHSGAIEAARGGTIAVVAGGIDVLTPAALGDRAEAIRSRGAILACNPRGTPPLRFRFFERNAVIAALATHVVMVAAPFRSGARNTMAVARALGKTRWASTAHAVDPRTHGGEEELRLGARALGDGRSLLAELGVDVSEGDWLSYAVERLGGPSREPRGIQTTRRKSPVTASPTRRPSSTTPPPRRPLPPPESFGNTLGQMLPAPTERAVLEVVLGGPVSLDRLVAETGLPVATLRALLLTWTVEGIVKERPDGQFEPAMG